MKRTCLALAAVAMLGSGPLFASQAAPPPAQAAKPDPQQEAKPEAKADPKAAASYVGKWNLDIQGPQGPTQATLEAKIDSANKVTGTLSSQVGVTPIAGEFKDSKLGFSISFDAGGQMVEIYFEGTLKDEKLSGTMDFGQGQFPWTAIRVKG